MGRRIHMGPNYSGFTCIYLYVCMYTSYRVQPNQEIKNTIFVGRVAEDLLCDWVGERVKGTLVLSH